LLREQFHHHCLKESYTVNDDHEYLIKQIRLKAENLYSAHRLFCSESVLLALNDGLGGGLTESQAVSLTAGLTIGVGGSGCMCGALNGGIVGTGLFLGRKGAYRTRREIREASAELHDCFKNTFHSTCCRVLTRKVKDDPKRHFRRCAELTGTSAEMAARLIIHRRPEFAERITPARKKFIQQRDSKVFGFLMSIAKLFRSPL
jgi:C_GCAxxG_C_C family probable redox protein